MINVSSSDARNVLELLKHKPEGVSAEDYLRSIAYPETIINLTPHEIVILDEARHVLKRFPAAPYEICPRAITAREEVATMDGVPVARMYSEGVANLPEIKDNTYYIVSCLVATACSGEREDLLVPDKPVRDADGRVIGCKGLVWA